MAASLTSPIASNEIMPHKSLYALRPHGFTLILYIPLVRCFALPYSNEVSWGTGSIAVVYLCFPDVHSKLC